MSHALADCTTHRPVSLQTGLSGVSSAHVCRRHCRAATARERILSAAYDLYSTRGIRDVGVDEVIEQAGVAKATLYRHFSSKDELVIAFLDLREQRWVGDWVVAEATRRADTAEGRLLAIFDLFDEGSIATTSRAVHSSTRCSRWGRTTPSVKHHSNNSKRSGQFSVISPSRRTCATQKRSPGRGTSS